MSEAWEAAGRAAPAVGASDESGFGKEKSWPWPQSVQTPLQPYHADRRLGNQCAARPVALGEARCPLGSTWTCARVFLKVPVAEAGRTAGGAEAAGI